MRRLMWSRHPDKFEVEVVEEYIRELIFKRKDLRNVYIYVNLDTEDGGIEIVNYPVQSIQVVAKELECSEREALYCCAKFPGFLLELRETLYWNDINGLCKYIIVTEELDNREQLKLHEAVTYARNKKEARAEFVSMGFRVNSIEDVDE